MQRTITLLLSLTILISCQKQESKGLTSFEIYCEMVANDAKPIALHNPLEPSEVDASWEQFLEIAERYNVKLYREDDFPESLLFNPVFTRGKTVVLIYTGDRLVQYKQWKSDLDKSYGSPEELARRWGRLLGYGSHGINKLLSKNSDFRTLASFGVEKQTTHLYYDDLNVAKNFYSEILGFNEVGNSIFQIGQDSFIQLHEVSDQHPEDQSKSTAIAFLTDQLSEWYAHVQALKVPIKYTYKPKDGGPHDGFVAIDPGGYLLEFEQFKQHPENEGFMAVLSQAPRIKTAIQDLNFYGSITWTYHKDLLLMQKFYEEKLGYQLVADQGWTKIYQTSNTGFIGLVDERRGMQDYADTKAVEVEWTVTEPSAFNTYASKNWEMYAQYHFEGPERYQYLVSTSDTD